MKAAFFIGWTAPPKPLRAFLAVVAASLVIAFASLGWLLSATQDDPGGGAFRFDWGPQTATGVLTTAPYPVLHVTDSDRWPSGKALLLAGQGKRGVRAQVEGRDGALVTISGIALTRGDLEMVQVSDGPDGLVPAAGAGTAPERVDLGRWRITGEICDGKCYAGAMRPGQGIAHKACANLCLIGEVPPLFVATGDVEGADILLIGGPDGGSLPEALLARTAELIEIEGRVERIGAMTVFNVNPESVRRAR